jgi:uncharacterized protein
MKTSPRLVPEVERSKIRILALSDEVKENIPFPRHNTIDRIDLVIGCGDLPSYYLNGISRTLDIRSLFVPGNHDKKEDIVKNIGQNIDLKIVRPINSLIVAGAGGSFRYRSHVENQYSETQMAMRIFFLSLLLLSINVKKIDLFITHNPPKGINDGEDLPHQGFKSFLWFITKFNPTVMLHGHTYNYGKDDNTYLGTKVINVTPYKLITLPEKPYYPIQQALP